MPLTYGILNKAITKTELIDNRECIGGCQRQKVGVGKRVQKVKTSTHKRSKSWACNLQHGGYI